MNNSSTKIVCGDPPYLSGPTNVGSIGAQAVWIGDYPPPPPYQPYKPSIEIMPVPQKIYPQADILSGWSTVSVTSPPCKWRAAQASDGLTLTIDMPGLRSADACIELENGSLKVTGKRFDTGLNLYEQYTIGTDYDPKSASAVLDAGVLTITVKRFKEKRPHRVPVTDK